MEEIKRLVLDIDATIHKEIKKRCAIQGKTMKQWFMEALVHKMRQEDMPNRKE